jgi:hypothetical protein
VDRPVLKVLLGLLEPPVNLGVLVLQALQVSKAYLVTLAFLVPAVHLEALVKLELLVLQE